MRSLEYKLPEVTSQREVLDLIHRLNNDDSVNGILVQLPLPAHISEEDVIDAIDPSKDVDGFSTINSGRLASGIDGALIPCTPKGCITLAKWAIGDDLTGKNAVVIGRSNIVGKPVTQLLLKENCTVTIAHSRTTNLPELCRTADILIAAVGRPGMVESDWIKPGATVIDVGINRITDNSGKHKLIGDVDFERAKDVAGAITPVPGGVGPMTIACLMGNTLEAFMQQNGLYIPLTGNSGTFPDMHISTLFKC